MPIQRIIYGAPPSDTPAGGVKVIYQNSEYLNSIGIDSAIWHPNDEDFQCTWFANQIKKIKLKELRSDTDLIVLPEIWASSHVSIFKDAGFKVAIYVQNCYLTHVNLNAENSKAIQDAYVSADLVLSISQDTTGYLKNILNVSEDKIMLQRYSINHDLFKTGDKQKIITYMPRKMADHSARVVSALNALPATADWKIVSIHNMHESQVAQALSQSIIFLAFSEFEGLPVPPVEAALCGNFVIGYDGQGGKEYWKKPNFERIEQGNIQAFIQSVLARVASINAGHIDLSSVNEGIQQLAHHFSKEEEANLIHQFIERAKSLN